MANKKDEVIEVVNLTVTTPKLYKVIIRGHGTIIFNKTPDFSIPKSKNPKGMAKEDPLEKERRTWKSKAYAYDDGKIYIPGENIHQCLQDGCKYWGQKIAGEGQKTYTDVMKSAVVCQDIKINATVNDLIEFGKNVNGNPSKSKGSSTVYRIRPLLPSWEGSFDMHVFDARLTQSILQVVLTYAGTFKGLCDWRPIHGRFDLVSMEEVS